MNRMATKDARGYKKAVICSDIRRAPLRDDHGNKISSMHFAWFNNSQQGHLILKNVKQQQVWLFIFRKSASTPMQGSYHVGNTASRPISEVKQR
jgi:hypothetical protein